MAVTLKVSVRPGGPAGSRGESLIVTLRGELDVATAPALAARFDRLLSDRPGQIVVDVSRLTFIDAAGLRLLAALRAQGRQRLVAVRLCGVSPRTRRLLAIVSPAASAGSAGPGTAALATPRTPRRSS